MAYSLTHFRFNIKGQHLKSCQAAGTIIIVKPPESDSQSSKLRVQILDLCTKHGIDGQTTGDIAEIVDKKSQEIADIKKMVPPPRTTPPIFPTFRGFMVGSTSAAAMDWVIAAAEAR